MKTSGKILNILLILSILIAASLLLIIKGRLKSLKTENQTISRRIAETQQDQSMEEETVQTDLWNNYINQEKPKFYDPSIEDEIYQLGQDLSSIIRKNSLRIDFYNIYEKEEKKYFNYTLAGTPVSCFKLIRTLSRNEKYFTLDTISIERNGDTSTMNILFAPAVLPAQDEEETQPVKEQELPDIRTESGAEYTATPGYIASRLFYTPAVPVPVETEGTEQEAPQEQSVKNAPYWLSYIGHSIEDGSNRYYFLDTRTNRTIEIIPGSQSNAFEITEYLDGGFYINLSGEPFYVNKY